MSTIKSSAEHLTLNADGTGKDVIIQSNATEKLRLTAEGNLHLQGSDSRIQLNAQGGANVVGSNTVHIRADGADLKLMSASGGACIYEANGSEKLRIDSAGRVTMPDQPSFMARGFSQRLSAYNSVQFNTVHHNIGGHYDNSTGIFTAPTAGRYFISWIANIKASSSYMGWDLAVNGTAFLQSYSDIGTINYDMVGGTVVLDLAASDNLRVYNTPSYAAPSTSITYSHFSVHLLG